ncbi:hypothetical protein K2X30_03070 [bacterium]|jgi:Flp pilus assembly pilin Flp|nr:hypothetical protein [bacterium]
MEGFLRKIIQNLSDFSKQEDGQAITEYILLLSATIISAVAMARAIKNGLDEGVLSLGGQLEKDLRTGKAPLNVWK